LQEKESKQEGTQARHRGLENASDMVNSRIGYNERVLKLGRIGTREELKNI
jgi:hypothetical protein